MSRLDFLKEVLPFGARYSLRLIRKIEGQKDAIVRNRFYPNVDSMEPDIQEYVENGWDVYYATAGFGAAAKADDSNAVSKREFYIDVDCGKNKPYADKVDGLQALKKFCKEVGLPKPTVIDSGNGIHAHWFFDEPVPVHEWKVVAESLKKKCVDLEFYVDGSCTADTVRVLRVPGTINFKGPHPVGLINKITHHSFASLKTIIGENIGGFLVRAKALSASKEQGSGLTEVQKLIASNRTSKFQTIWIKSQNGTGCAQINYAIENADTLPEPQWRAVLSVAQYCEDKDWAIHEVSKNHPDYDPDTTEAKAAKTKGPYTCESFQGLDHPELCKNCPHSGKIKSPIQLGVEIRKAEESDNKITVERNGSSVEEYIPSYPAPYFRGKHGGIYQYVGTDEGTGEKKEEIIYHHDLYVYKRMRDAELGDVAWLRNHLPMGDVRDFMLPQSDIASLDRLREGITKQGVAVFHIKQLGRIQDFLARQIQDLQFKEKASNMHTRFGWTPQNTFIVGDKEYTDKGVKYAPMAGHLQNFIRWFTPTGSLDQWKKVVDHFKPEEFDMHAVGVLAGFASVLMHLSPENGAVINYYSKKSGTGKTTVLKLANSIFGDPKALMKNAADTALSKVHRMGLLNGIVLTLDEMTNVHADEISNLLYGVTHGRGRDRMQGSINAERVNDTTWKGISLWSSNASVQDRLSAIKIDPQGELARVIEVHVESQVADETVLANKQLFDSIDENYGHAADIFLRWLIPNMSEARRYWLETQEKIYAMQNWTQTERFKLNAVICIATAGIITEALGLLNYDIVRIIKKLTADISDNAEELRSTSMKAVETFATFTNRNVNNLLIVNGTQRLGALQEAAMREPKGSLLIRYEPDTKMLYVAQRDFNKWCADNYINAREIGPKFKQETGRVLRVVKKRMAKGWNADFGPVTAYEIPDAHAVLGLEGIENELPRK